MNRFGDTPEGMVESAIEFAQIARDLDYHSLVFSMKASNVKAVSYTHLSGDIWVATEGKGLMRLPYGGEK